jgi:ATP-dependent RNA helicase RhlE
LADDKTSNEEFGNITFQDLGVSEKFCAAIKSLDWERPTPVQSKAIPACIDGHDIVGIAQTGTGKTGAFMIPCLEKIKVGEGFQILVLCPTRELAQQVCDDTRSMAKGTKIRSVAIYGGVGYGPQLDAFQKGVEVIVATPGRFLDHMGSGKVNLDLIRTLIFDEADRMLDMGFRPQIESLLKEMPRNRQTMLFSATMPRGVHDLASRITKNAVWVEVTPSGTKADGITELVYSVKPEMKPDLLLKLLENADWKQVLVFTRTKAGADVLKVRLEHHGIRTAAMHSNLGMSDRTKALGRFSDKEVQVLVATDIAQRGLDVEGISHVVNYDVPQDPEDYTHRIGRTARAGAVGTAVTFLAAGDLGAFKSLTHHLGRDLERIHISEFDYAGTPKVMSRNSSERSHSQTGMGSRTPDDLTDEELAKLLEY